LKDYIEEKFICSSKLIREGKTGCGREESSSSDRIFVNHHEGEELMRFMRFIHLKKGFKKGNIQYPNSEKTGQAYWWEGKDYL